MPDDEARHKVVPLEVDVRFNGLWDEIAAVLASLGETSDGYTEHENDRDKHPVEARLRAWGWVADLYDATTARRVQTIELRGIWGDWTWLEDDQRLMPALAQFAEDDGRIIFQDPVDANYSNGLDIKAWVFKEGDVAVHDVDQEIEYWIR